MLTRSSFDYNLIFSLTHKFEFEAVYHEVISKVTIIFHRGTPFLETLTALKLVINQPVFSGVLPDFGSGPFHEPSDTRLHPLQY
jgi:hypothetical protein